MKKNKTIKQKGFTLVELMVSLLIGLVITIGIFNVFATNQITFREKTKFDNAQDGFRYTSQSINRLVQFSQSISSASSNSMTIEFPASASGFDLKDCANNDATSATGTRKNTIFFDTTNKILKCTDVNGSTHTLLSGIESVSFLYAVDSDSNKIVTDSEYVASPTGDILGTKTTITMNSTLSQTFKSTIRERLFALSSTMTAKEWLYDGTVTEPPVDIGGGITDTANGDGTTVTSPGDLTPAKNNNGNNGNNGKGKTTTPTYPAAGTILSQTCTYNGQYVTKTADGSGGETTTTVTDNPDCTVEGTIINKTCVFDGQFETVASDGKGGTTTNTADANDATCQKSGTVLSSSSCISGTNTYTQTIADGKGGSTNKTVTDAVKCPLPPPNAAPTITSSSYSSCTNNPVTASACQIKKDTETFINFTVNDAETPSNLTITTSLLNVQESTLNTNSLKIKVAKTNNQTVTIKITVTDPSDGTVTLTRYLKTTN